MPWCIAVKRLPSRSDDPRPGVPRRAGRAMVRISPRPTAMGWPHNHGCRAGAHRAHRQWPRLASLLARRADHGAERRLRALRRACADLSSHRNIAPRDEALLLATAAGVLFGVSDIAIKYLSHAQNPVFGLITPWTLTAAISFVNSFYASARRASTRHPEPTASGKRPHHLACRGRGTPAASLVDSAVPRWA